MTLDISRNVNRHPLTFNSIKRPVDNIHCKIVCVFALLPNAPKLPRRMGRYCAWLEMDGTPAPWLQQIDSISGNGRHAIVIAPELVRLEMLRVGHTYELAITRLWLKTVEGHARPVIATAPVFRGHQGTLGIDNESPSIQESQINFPSQSNHKCISRLDD